MSEVSKMMGIPYPDKDGTFKVQVEEKDGAISLIAGGYPFVKCVIKDGSPVVQVIDCDTGVRSEHNIAVLCWRR